MIRLTLSSLAYIYSKHVIYSSIFHVAVSLVLSHSTFQHITCFIGVPLQYQPHTRNFSGKLASVFPFLIKNAVHKSVYFMIFPCSIIFKLKEW